MKWIEIKIKTTEEASDAVAEMLTSIGAGGVAIEDPNDIRREIEKPNSIDYADEEFINSLGEDVLIKAYFPGTNSIVELTELIKEKMKFISQYLDIGEGYTGYSEVDDEDWSTAWKKYYKPLNISDRVVIKPTWEEYEVRNNEVIVELDPGMAFGTGTHETTKMCAQLLEKYIKDGDTVIDVGCGTGILSIIAAKLGAKHIDAVDVDEVAVRVTKENCSINKVSDKINAFKGILDDVKKEKVDVVVANIIANVIIDLGETMPHYLKKDGLLITSGIIKERKQEVIETYLKHGFVHEVTQELGEWVAIVFKCQDSL
ncbi:MAG: 50S ribosomal protein L11 methyltransferase [Clostridia bacterium]|nr:50S ribosomal protein L11 methyltransferase [Clostridia bacterium]